MLSERMGKKKRKQPVHDDVGLPDDMHDEVDDFLAGKDRVDLERKRGMCLQY